MVIVVKKKLQVVQTVLYQSAASVKVLSSKIVSKKKSMLVRFQFLCNKYLYYFIKILDKYSRSNKFKQNMKIFCDENFLDNTFKICDF